MHAGYDFVALVGLYTALAAVLDYRTKKIPNWLTVPAAVAGLAWHSFAPGGAGPLMALAGFALGFVLLLLPWILGGGGMGDVKMLAALGAWLGPVLILVSFGIAAVLAAVAAMLIIATSTMTEGINTTQHRYIRAGGGSTTVSTGSSSRKVRRVLPFAVPVAVSTWILLACLLVRGL